MGGRIYTGAEAAALRTAMGLSQQHLADMLDINVTTVRAWERERTRMSESSSAALDSLVAEFNELTDDYEAGGSVTVRKEAPDAPPPRAWHLAAAGRVMLVDPEFRVAWDRGDDQ